MDGCTEFYISAWEELQLKVTSAGSAIIFIASTFPWWFYTRIFLATFRTEKWNHFFKLAFHHHILIALAVIKGKA
jgi:hypothetical protein